MPDTGVRSEVGVGSAFLFEVALAVGSHPASAPNTDPTIGTTNSIPGLGGLIVEDHPTNRLLLHQMLGHLACSATQANDGVGALEALAHVLTKPIQLEDLEALRRRMVPPTPPELHRAAATRRLRNPQIACNHGRPLAQSRRLREDGAMSLRPRSPGDPTVCFRRRLPLVLSMCWLAGTPEATAARATTTAVTRVNEQAPAPPPAEDQPARLAHGLSGQLAVALGSHPRVEAAFHRWHAAAQSISAATTLPSPTVDFGVFVQSIETRTGPQIARVGVRQALPWPSGLVAERDAARAGAEAAGARFEATVLDVALAVEDAHWRLWAVRTMRSIHTDHHQLVMGLSTTVRGRVEVGAANLAHLQQVDLAHSRLSDDIARMDEAEAAAVAGLRAAVGQWSDDPLGTPEGPGGPWLPDEEPMLLEAAATAHPRLEAARHQVAGADARVQSARAARRPGFVVGADWILIAPGDPVHTDPEESGRDALSVGLGVQVPLWQRSAAERVGSAEATARAARFDVDHHALQARAALHQAIADVESTGRRVAVIEGTLLPQAEAAYASLLGTYTTGASSVAQALLAQQALLELRVERVQVQAEHARALARLRAACGRDVKTRRLVSVERP